MHLHLKDNISGCMCAETDVTPDNHLEPGADLEKHISADGWAHFMHLLIYSIWFVHD